ncbi:hypothetical protein [Flavobacterium caseinilyticum]|uniref:Uncharacterized protein n=1 Tax=Flavobacterium caseinilyticum TaxID=2541732 RepID=A0A4R5B0A0_9FLAO|nr:hypothetical protein [Flavobacterium caseinilyticum]TDD78483.1 hypothetical protein E0F89_02290 [Flavobacterium caseinilyticum]
MTSGKQRIQRKNEVAERIYMIGTLLGRRSQWAIAPESSAAVSTDILILWNDGLQINAHDRIKQLFL